jgi:hypothetical protein
MKYAIVLLIALAGCANTFEQLKQESQRSVHMLKQPPELAAACLARNADNFASGYKSVSRLIDTGYEVVVRVGDTDRVLALAYIVPQNAGSEASVWITKEFAHRRDALLPAIIAAC